MKEALRYRLLAAQLEMARQAARSVVVVITGQAATGKTALINELNHRLENRLTEVHALAPSSEERARPYWWRYWRRLPARGRVGVFVHGWYGDALFGRADQRLGAGAFRDRLEQIRAFEAELAAEGVALVKLWLDIDRHVQARHLKALLQDPERAWQVKDSDWQRHLQHHTLAGLGKQLREATEAGHAPWHRLQGGPEHKPVTTLIHRLVEAMAGPLPRVERVNGPGAPPSGEAVPRLAQLSGGARPKLAKAAYRRALAEAQARLAGNARAIHRRGIPVVLVFEGHDAAGKGGSIHRLTSALDARGYRVHRIAAPSDEERAHPWAWRFWRRLPLDGRFAIFDRSWYGRVLVERVEGLATPAQWQRAFDEIRRFEGQLLAHGAVVGKLFLAIDKDEQLRRFHARAETPHKRHKLTEEDWRNRARWDDYCRAIDEMFVHTHDVDGGWALIDANDKRRARLAVLDHVNALLERRLAAPE
ncbi:polyphosphate:AMP phosphotransferase [Halomonas nitroreducens]|uniref:Polyphosphate:AMP phosphotransferase n=1 Tax=Halomonas nitroreducens TaxID=447425 RepID=A0A431V915_9GAMM|nr:polyphosphate:AMP phosphotransferase [Halomonas nitroreducens]RTR07162.1 polyphosphate:AMP phosphotransferase [Halomonas nitroreducens]